MIPNLVLYLSLLLLRVGAFVAVLPLFGGQSMPRLVRLGLAMSMTVLYAGTMDGSLMIHQWLVGQTGVGWLAFGVALGREAVLGALLGFAFSLFLIPARIAGEYLSQELGLSFGNLINPTGGTSGGTLAQMLDLLSTLLFLGLDGHHLFFAVFDYTLGNYPIGAALPEIPVEKLVVGVSQATEWGLMLAAPTALCLFVVTVILALLARVAPQMNIYAVGFPLRLMVGLVESFLLFPNFAAALLTLLGRSGQLVRSLV